MREFFLAAISPAGLKTVAVCLAIEAAILLVFFLFTDSWISSMWVSFVLVGPISFYLSAPIYRHFKGHA
jgi:uncharacterized protein (DUF983 family)